MYIYTYIYIHIYIYIYIYIYIHILFLASVGLGSGGTTHCATETVTGRKSPGLLLYCAILDVVSSTVCLCIFLHISDPVEFSPAPAPAPTHAAPSPTAVAQAQRQNQRQRALDPPRMQHQPNVNANARQRHSPREHTAPAPAPAPAPAHGISLSPTPRSANDHPRALEFQKSWVDSETYAQVLEGIKDGVAEGYYASYSGIDEAGPTRCSPIRHLQTKTPTNASAFTY